MISGASRGPWGEPRPVGVSWCRRGDSDRGRVVRSIPGEVGRPDPSFPPRCGRSTPTSPAVAPPARPRSIPSRAASRPRPAAARDRPPRSPRHRTIARRLSSDIPEPVSVLRIASRRAWKMRSGSARRDMVPFSPRDETAIVASGRSRSRSNKPPPRTAAELLRGTVNVSPNDTRLVSEAGEM